MLGHVIPRPFSHETAVYYTKQLNTWLTFVDISKVKAFVELTVAPTIRAGTQSLLAVSLSISPPLSLSLSLPYFPSPHVCTFTHHLISLARLDGRSWWNEAKHACHGLL